MLLDLLPPHSTKEAKLSMYAAPLVPQACAITMQADGVSRRDFFKAAAIGIAAAPLAARAEVEYAGVPYRESSHEYVFESCGLLRRSRWS